jgi:nuclear transport factor 2 (NTF2) superfamily protein
MITSETARPPVPPFDRNAAIKKVRLAEDAWNTRDPEKVASGYTPDSLWRNRSDFFSGREEIIQFLRRKWARELDYRLVKELWVFGKNRIAVRFAYEWHDDSGNWFRSYGNENWEFDENGFMARRLASINDLPIREADRKYHWLLKLNPLLRGLGKVVHIVHDEIVVQCRKDHAKKVETLLASVMVEAAEKVLPGCGMKVETAVSKSWSKKDKINF